MAFDKWYHPTFSFSKGEWKMLKEKVAIVTGGTRGIGYAIVKKYLMQWLLV